MPDLDTLLGWRGRTVVDRDGEQVGRLDTLYLDDATDRPAWGGVRTGRFGRHESIVPLDALTERGEQLVADQPAALIRDAPSLDPDAALDPADEERLARHYGDRPAAPGAPAAPAPPAATGDDDAVEVVRSEEELTSGTPPMRPAERVRLRKVLVTEHVTRTVPVRREEVRLETDPPPAGRVESAEDLPPEAPAR